MSDQQQDKFEDLVSRMESNQRLASEAQPGAKVYFENKMVDLKNELLEMTRTTKTSDESVWKAAIPSNETERLETLRRLGVLDTPYEPLFDSITRVAATICGTPIAIISFTDENRQWFKASYGMSGVIETPRDRSFCSHTILSDVIMEVPDATIDSRFQDNPYVLGDPQIRFYAGAPLLVIPGMSVGTLCVIDREVGKLSEQQKQSLEGLAQVIVDAMLLRQELNSQTG